MSFVNGISRTENLSGIDLVPGVIKAEYEKAKDSTGYANVIEQVWKDVTYNYGLQHAGNPLNFFEEPSYDEVKSIIDVYINLVTKTQRPEYNADGSQCDSSCQSQMTTLINEISQNAGVSIDEAKTVMDDLYWGTIQGRMSNTAVIFPRSHPDGATLNQTPDMFVNKGILGQAYDAAGNIVDAAGNIIKSAGDVIGGTASTLAFITKNLPWFLIGGVGLIILWKGTELVQMFHHNKE